MKISTYKIAISPFSHPPVNYPPHLLGAAFHEKTPFGGIHALNTQESLYFYFYLIKGFALNGAGVGLPHIHLGCLYVVRHRCVNARQLGYFPI